MGVRTELVLVRHGETDWNRTLRYQGTSDIPLNGLGIAQARIGGQRLAEEQWDAIVASPLIRVMQTARVISEATGIPDIAPDSDLMERRYGDAEGLTIEERQARWPNDVWPGLEPRDELRIRATRALKAIYADHTGQRVIVVSHGGTINSILASISDGEVGSGISQILNVSFTRIHSDDGENWTIESVSDVEHLLQEADALNAMTPRADTTEELVAAAATTKE